MKPRLDNAAREELAYTLEERARLRPPMPPMLSAEDREENREILRRMQDKVSFMCNPRCAGRPEGRGEFVFGCSRCVYVGRFEVSGHCF